MSRNTTVRPPLPNGLPLSFNHLLANHTGSEKGYLVYLDSKMIYALSVLNRHILPYYWVWGISRQFAIARQYVIDLAERIEVNLMTGVLVSDLIKTNLMLVNALRGGEYDPENLPSIILDTDDNLLSQSQKNSLTVAGAIDNHSDVVGGSLTTINDTLTDIAALIEQAVGQNLEDELTDIKTTIATIATILGVV